MASMASWAPPNSGSPSTATSSCLAPVLSGISRSRSRSNTLVVTLPPASLQTRAITLSSVKLLLLSTLPLHKLRGDCQMRQGGGHTGSCARCGEEVIVICATRITRKTCEGKRVRRHSGLVDKASCAWAGLRPDESPRRIGHRREQLFLPVTTPHVATLSSRFEAQTLLVHSQVAFPLLPRLSTKAVRTLGNFKDVQFYSTRNVRQFWADPTFSDVRSTFLAEEEPKMLKFYSTQNFVHFWAAILKMSGFTHVEFWPFWGSLPGHPFDIPKCHQP